MSPDNQKVRFCPVKVQVQHDAPAPELLEIIEETGTTSTAKKRLRGRPPGPVKAARTSKIPSLSGPAPRSPSSVPEPPKMPPFSTLVRVQLPDKQVGRKKKVEKGKIKPYGPFDTPLEEDYEDFKSRVATVTKCRDVSQLEPDQWMWRWSVPANSIEMGLSDSDNYDSMVQAYKSLGRAKAAQKFIILMMPPPKPTPAADPVCPAKTLFVSCF